MPEYMGMCAKKAVLLKGLGTYAKQEKMFKTDRFKTPSGGCMLYRPQRPFPGPLWQGGNLLNLRRVSV